MEQGFADTFAEGLQRLRADAGAFASAVLDPAVVLQLAVIIAALLLSVALTPRVEAAFEARVRSVHGRPRLLRLLALLLRRTRWLVAALLLGIAALFLRTLASPSDAVIVAIAAALIAAWVVISVTARLIRNRILARLVAWVAWIYVALRITGMLDPVSRALDLAAIRFGTLNISAYDVIQAAIVISVALWLAATLGRFFERQVAASSDLTPSLKVLIGKLVRIVLLVIAAGVALTALGIDLTALTVFSGALGVGIGFGLQKVVSNFVSGIIILLDKSIKPGDTISLGETFGWVRSLRSRFVSVMTRDGTEYLVPNEDFITQQVVSWSHTDTLHRLDVEFAIASTCDPHAVRRAAIEATKAVNRVEGRPAPVCHLTGFDGSSVQYILRFWIADPQNGVTNVRGAVLLACWDAFAAAGFELSLDTREIRVQSAIPVRVEPAPAAASGAPDRPPG